MTNMITIKHAARTYNVPYTVIQGWIRRGRVAAIRAGQGGSATETTLDGRVVYHSLVDQADVRALAEAWLANNKPVYLTYRQRMLWKRKQSVELAA